VENANPPTPKNTNRNPNEKAPRSNYGSFSLLPCPGPSFRRLQINDSKRSVKEPRISHSEDSVHPYLLPTHAFDDSVYSGKQLPRRHKHHRQKDKNMISKRAIKWTAGIAAVIAALPLIAFGVMMLMMTIIYS
jgi:hypothetical protein